MILLQKVLGELRDGRTQLWWRGMFSRKEQCTEDQILCWNCEEAVHQTAISCPYCNVEIHRHPVQKATSSQKITPLSQPSANADHSRTPEHADGLLQTLRFACSLFCLLAGSAMLFLSLLIALFAKGGTFTLSWNAHSWSAFLGLGLASLSFGTMFFQKLSSSSDEP